MIQHSVPQAHSECTAQTHFLTRWELTKICTCQISLGKPLLFLNFTHFHGTQLIAPLANVSMN